MVWLKYKEVNNKDIIDGEGSYSRKWDTEFKILEDITDQLKGLKPQQQKGRIDYILIVNLVQVVAQ